MTWWTQWTWWRVTWRTHEHEEEWHDEHNEHEEEWHDEHNEHEEEWHDEHNEHEEEWHDEHEYQYILDAQDEVAKGHDHGHSDEIEHEEHSDDDVNKYLADEWEGHVHAESSIDPHVWTWKVNALLIAKKIQEELSKIQPSQADNFEINYNRFEAEIVKVFSDFDTLVEGKNQKEFIVFHDAYNYLLFDAGIDLEKKLIFRSNVMANPGSADMKELTDEVKLHGITSFFVEPQFESKALKLFAGENNWEILELDPLWSSIDAEGFIGNIKSNLEALSNIYE